MAIPSSGALSLSDIQTEFGGSNPIGMDEYYAGGSYVASGTSGTNGAVPTSGAISLSSFFGTAAVKYFMGYATDSTLSGESSSFSDVVFDSSGNSYQIGFYYYNGIPQTYLQKVSDAGVLQWTRFVTPAGGNMYGIKGAIDASGNVYVLGYLLWYPVMSPPGPGIKMLVVKYNSSGTFQWQRHFGGTSGGNTWNPSPTEYGIGYVLGTSVGIDASNYLHCVGTNLNDNGLAYIQYLRIDGSYNVIYSTVVGLGGYYSGSSGESLQISASHTISSADTFVLVNFTYSPYGSTAAGIFKIDSSAALGFSGTAKVLAKIGGGYAVRGYGITSDSSGNFYITGHMDTDYGRDIITAMFNSSGALVWMKHMTYPGSTYAQGNSIKVDSSGNVYVAGHIQTSGVRRAALIKYNSSGTLQWQRELFMSSGGSGGGTSAEFQGINLKSGNPFVVGAGPQQSGALFDYFPADGSKTGTYLLDDAYVTYQASSGTDTYDAVCGVLAQTAYSSSYSLLSSDYSTGYSITQSSSGKNSNNFITIL